jgi:hypothetical protein
MPLMRRCRLSLPLLRALAAAATVGAASATLPAVASAGAFAFARTDYLLESHLNGLDSVAVADLDGKNGPDLIIESLTAQAALGTVNVLLNNGDGTFAPAQTFDSCNGANSIVVGQFNPETDSHLDVALICGNQQEIGRMLGDGQGHFGAVQTVGVGYLTGASPAALVEFLRVGAMDGPALVFGGYLAGLGTTLCFLRVSDFESTSTAADRIFRTATCTSTTSSDHPTMDRSTTGGRSRTTSRSAKTSRIPANPSPATRR